MQNDLDMNSNDILNAKALNVQTLSINGTQVSAGTLPATEIPEQGGNSGKYLTTNGTSTSWSQIDASDAEFTQSGVGASATTVEAKLQEFVSVKDFGATGDGVTDDTTAIQACIDAVELAGGGTVFFPNGTYIVTSTLVVDEPGMKLVGESRGIIDPFNPTREPIGSVIKLGDHAMDSASDVILQLTYTDQSYSAIPKMGFVVRDLTIFGNRADGTGTSLNPTAVDAKNLNTYGIGIEILGVRDVTIDNCVIGWCAEEGIKTSTGGPDNTSPGCVITNTWTIANGSHGIRYSGGDSIISTCQCGFNGDNGIYLNGSCTVTGCGAWDNFGPGIGVLASDITISGSYCYDNKEAGIKVATASPRIVISGNNCQDNGKDTGLTATQRAGVFITSGATCVVWGLTTSNKDESTVTGQQYGLRINGAATDVVYGGISDGGGTANGVALISDGGAWPDITLATDTLTLTNRSEVQPRGESGVADDLSTISGQISAQFLVLRGNGTETITVKDAVANSNLAGGDFAMDSSTDILVLIRSSNTWYEVSRSNNA